MQGRELLSKMIRSYFILVTLIDVVIWITGCMIHPEESFGYEVFAYPLLYAFVGVLPQLVMYAKHELTVKEVVLRKFIQLLLIEILVNGIIFGKNVFSQEYLLFLKTVSISIVIVFILANVINWLMDNAQAKKMTKELETFQKLNQ